MAEVGWTFRSGVVLEKWYEPRREWDTQESSCSAYDKNGSCTARLWWTQHHVDDEDWVVKVRGCQENRPDKCKTEDWELTQARWESVAVGDVIERS